MVLAQMVVRRVGREAIAEYLWQWYVWLGLAGSVGKHRAVVREMLAVARERNSVSPQDQYAKWTKLKRRLDALGKEKEGLEEEVGRVRGLFGKGVLWGLTLVLSGPVWWCRGMYRKEVVVEVKGVMPGMVEWGLGLPFQPAGVVGVGMWLMCVGMVVKEVERGVAAVVVAVRERAQAGAAEGVAVAENAKASAGKEAPVVENGEAVVREKVSVDAAN